MKPVLFSLTCLVLPLFFLLRASAQEATNSSSCSAKPASYERLSAQLKESLNCVDVLASNWTQTEIFSVLNSLHAAIKTLEKVPIAGCQDAHPKQCPAPVVHSKGGLACVTIGDARYCKPMCNDGFDFNFLRRSRLYEECKAGPKPSWTTQYVGGNRLATCSKSNIQISGAKTAYFPKGQDCMTTKSQSDLEKKVIQTFVSELEAAGIKGPVTYECLICG
ncbi:hypothetical protein GJAV_G00239700 [Gymnothorax javanicus]|nr:hypothetical protein GJAV_G00239700 [Gymnothorax javanicus]